MLNNLQALRAFAALNVVLFHVILKSWSYDHDVQFFSRGHSWGANGVDIFFVISGFVMVYIQSVRPKSAGEFLVNRILRIVPIYWVLTIAVLFLFAINPAFFRTMDFEFGRAVFSFLFMSQLVAGADPLLNLGWTLEWEMLFYLIFSICLLVQNRTVSFWAPIFILCVLVAVFGVRSIVLEFVLGMLAAKLYLHGYARAGSTLVFLIGVSLLLITLVEKSDMVRLIIWGFPSFLIVLGAAGMRQIKTGLLTYLGAASYSIYLVQFFSIPAFYKAVSKLPFTIDADGLIVVALVATAATGCIVHELIEKPLSNGLRTRWAKPRKNTLA